jgi:hypothetical protein
MKIRVSYKTDVKRIWVDLGELEVPSELVAELAKKWVREVSTEAYDLNDWAQFQDPGCNCEQCVHHRGARV